MIKHESPIRTPYPASVATAWGCCAVASILWNGVQTAVSVYSLFSNPDSHFICFIGLQHISLQAILCNSMSFFFLNSVAILKKPRATAWV